MNDPFARCGEHDLGDARADCIGCAYALLLREKQVEWRQRKDTLDERRRMAERLKELLEMHCSLRGLVVTEDGDITMPLAFHPRKLTMKLEIK